MPFLAMAGIAIAGDSDWRRLLQLAHTIRKVERASTWTWLFSQSTASIFTRVQNVKGL